MLIKDGSNLQFYLSNIFSDWTDLVYSTVKTEV